MTNLKQVIDGRAVRRYKRVVLLTLVTLYGLILVGGIVRATGAGMGCPDWPKCFGSWVPPTDISQLPANYKEIYGAKLKGEIEFNPVKTWIEYFNRLFGVFTGAWIFITLLASLSFLRTGQKLVFYLSLAAFLLVSFQGWLGAKVVSSELHPVMITLHMLLAIVIVFVLLFAYAKVSYVDGVEIEQHQGGRKAINRTLIVVLLLSLFQIMWGTQVREAMDLVVMRLGYEQRERWIEEIGTVFLLHRSFSIVVLGANLWLMKLIRERMSGEGIIKRLMKWVLVVLALEIGTGVVLNYWNVPAFAQPLHLTLAVILMGIQFVVYLFLNAGNVFQMRKVIVNEG